MYLKRITIASLLALAIFGAVYGLAASISISGVQTLGSGDQVVLTPGGTSSDPSNDITAVKWVLASNNPSLVDKVNLTFQYILPSGTVVYIKPGTSLDWQGPITPTLVSDTTYECDLPTDVAASLVDHIYVVVVGP
jgi:hypothetical protein